MDLLSNQSISRSEFDGPGAKLLMRDRSVLVRFDEQRMRAMALLCFVDPLPSQCLLLERLSLRGWYGLIRWLDYSGLALYFLDRLGELRLKGLLPDSVRIQLEHNLANNTARTQGMVIESLAIQQEFQDTKLTYANVKGFSLVPRSVPKPELRSQFDLDFLVAEDSAKGAREILETRGYRLYSATAKAMEFKRNERPGFSLKDLYKDLNSWRVELHICERGRPSSLDRVEWTELNGYPVPVLSAVDAFLGQGTHVCKHLCGEFSRAAHLLEFRRHLLSRADDASFWADVYQSGKDNPRIRIGLGLVTHLIEQVMGEFAPGMLKEWTVRTLPESVVLWVRMYGRRAVLRSFPGSKLYLLLQSALEQAGVPVKKRARSSLIPSRLPPPIILPSPRESISTRILRHFTQAGFVLSRLRFHVVEGLRYLWELQRWRLATDRQAD